MTLFLYSKMIAKLKVLVLEMDGVRGLALALVKREGVLGFLARGQLLKEQFLSLMFLLLYQIHNFL